MTTLRAYIDLTRLNRPIGIYLLLWPTLCGLWLAAGGLPKPEHIVIFTLGVVLMRSAGCAINDYADRHFDGHVQRTRGRPLATGQLSARQALGAAAMLALASFGLVLLTNPLTVALSLVAILLAGSYPFMKRHTHWPQAVLGAAFAWGIPMAFTAARGEIPGGAWLLFAGVVVWTVVYDTYYAMVDRDDDLRIGVKSTAVLFGRHDRLVLGSLQLLTLALWAGVGVTFGLGGVYWLALLICAGLFLRQQWQTRHRDRDACFRAFLQNHWVGLALWLGIVGDQLAQ